MTGKTRKTRKQRLNARNRAKEMADRAESRAAQQSLDARNRAKEQADRDEARQQRLDVRNSAKDLADRDELRAEVLDSARTLLREINGPGRPGTQPVAVCEALCVDDIWGSRGMSICNHRKQQQ